VLGYMWTVISTMNEKTKRSRAENETLEKEAVDKGQLIDFQTPDDSEFVPLQPKEHGEQ